MRNDLTAARLRELLDYDARSGFFTWRVYRNSKARVGDAAGYVGSKGYLYITVDGYTYRAHRLAWLHKTGAWPVGEVDHKNTCRVDNWFKNLRDVDHNKNMQNQRKARTGKALPLGVSRCSGTPGFRARIQTDGVTKYIGTFPTERLAADAYLAAKRNLHQGAFP